MLIIESVSTANTSHGYNAGRWLVLLLCLFASSCRKPEQYGEQGVIVRGRIVRGGEPLPLDRPDVGLGVVDLQLIPQPEGASAYTNAGADGKFEFLGDGQGVKPGTYRLAVLHYKSGPGTDELGGKLDESKSPITITVPDKIGEPFELGDVELNDHLK